GTLSDKIGRKPIIMAGCLIAALTYFPLFTALTSAANPDLAKAQASSKVVVTADPSECSFQFNPTGTKKFTSSCDIVKQKLASASVSYDSIDAPAGTPATIAVGETVITSKVTPEDIAAAKTAAETKLADLKAAPTPDATAIAAAETNLKNLADEKKAPDAVLTAKLSGALKAAGYPAKADPAKVDKVKVVAILTFLVLLVTMVYGPIAAMLVELFPTRIRYTSMSLPYHIGNGWFGGLLPTTAFAIVAQTGNMYNGLWYPIIVAGVTFVIGMLFVKETKDVNIYADD
ncbi:MAG TPA: MFS transporter, partial [Burkholderiaceae bacterium]|nr:MFS transporter [Burkholderiaceae bacterium]